jgi:hypothetical protein
MHPGGGVHEEGGYGAGEFGARGGEEELLVRPIVVLGGRIAVVGAVRRGGCGSGRDERGG